MKKREPKHYSIFSSSRMIRLLFSSLLTSMFIALAILLIFDQLTPSIEKLNYVVIVIIFFIITAISAMIIYAFLTKTTVNVSEQINTAVKKISSGDFTARIELSGNPEIDDFVESFNKMAEELDSLVILNRDFVSNFSHEFKTPIVSVKGYAQLLKESATLSDEQSQWLDIIIEESERLSNLSQNAMTLSKLDTSSITSKKQVINIEEDLSRAILLFDKQLTDKNIDFIADIRPIYLLADKSLTKEIWINLLSNAIKYTPKNGKIMIETIERDDYVFIMISDSGNGVARENIEKIFDRNFQENNTQKYLGNGLGLAITRRIVELHHGKISVESSPFGGAKFVVKLPTKQKPNRPTFPQY